jgi:hypothetical protein
MQAHIDLVVLNVNDAAWGVQTQSPSGAWSPLIGVRRPPLISLAKFAGSEKVVTLRRHRLREDTVSVSVTNTSAPPTAQCYPSAPLSERPLYYGPGVSWGLFFGTKVRPFAIKAGRGRQPALHGGRGSNGAQCET